MFAIFQKKSRSASATRKLKTGPVSLHLDTELNYHCADPKTTKEKGPNV
jgi:hypothetical protein